MSGFSPRSVYCLPDRHNQGHVCHRGNVRPDGVEQEREPSVLARWTAQGLSWVRGGLSRDPLPPGSLLPQLFLLSL